MNPVASPLDLYFDQLNDLFSAERQLEVSLPELTTLVSDDVLRSLIAGHCARTHAQLAVIGEIFKRREHPPGHDECKAMAGLIEGGTAHLKAVGEPAARDLMMIAHCLRVEHYETAAYQITERLARRLGFDEDAEALADIRLEEETMASSLLAIEPRIFQRANGRS